MITHCCPSYDIYYHGNWWITRWKQYSVIRMQMILDVWWTSGFCRFVSNPIVVRVVTITEKTKLACTVCWIISYEKYVSLPPLLIQNKYPTLISKSSSTDNLKSISYRDSPTHVPDSLSVTEITTHMHVCFSLFRVRCRQPTFCV